MLAQTSQARRPCMGKAGGGIDEGDAGVEKEVAPLRALDGFTGPWLSGGVGDCDGGGKESESRGARDICGAGAAAEVPCWCCRWVGGRLGVSVRRRLTLHCHGVKPVR
jgi:hypothetical protein